MRRAGGLLIALAVLAVASDAAACTVLFLDPAGQAESDRDYQRALRADADAVFLARARPVFSRGGTVLESIVPIAGDRPPARAFRPDDTSDCMPQPAPRGVVIAFARRVRVADAGWKFWLWGRWTILGDVRPSEVRDNELAAALRDAARRSRQA